MVLGDWNHPLIIARRKMINRDDEIVILPPKSPVRPEDVKARCCEMHAKGGAINDKCRGRYVKGTAKVLTFSRS